MIGDLNHLDTARELEADICLIGSGPAGLTLAGELAGSGLDVLVVEAGGLTETPAGDDDRVDSVGYRRVADPGLLRNRVLGGTSHSWSGRCAPLAPLDFVPRPWVPHSGWPIAPDTLAPYLDRACSPLGLRQARYDGGFAATLDGRLPEVALDPALLAHCVWQFSAGHGRNHRDFVRFGPRFLAAPGRGVRLLVNATVAHLARDPQAPRPFAIELAGDGGRRGVVRARVAVLCAGGIENPRILLNSNRQQPSGLGNRSGQVGRFLMDHPRVILGRFGQADANRLRHAYGLVGIGRGAERRSFVRGIGLSEDAQRREALLNCAAWLTEERAADDPWDAAKRLLSRQHGTRAGRDLLTVLRQPGLMAHGAMDQLLRGRGVRHKLDRLVLDCTLEQRPDPDSRLFLSPERDRFGLARARLDWRVSDQERATVRRLGQAIGSEFARLGLPQVIPSDWVREKGEPDFRDASHPIGTTRMAADPQHGVVDENGQVFGEPGLFVAGSSVFPTGGQANPTLMIVALAIRLADHLKRVLAA